LTDERGKILSIGAAIGAFLPPAIAEMTDDEWAEHDARIARQRELDAALESESAAAARLAALAKAGFPARSLDAVKSADEERPYVRRIKAWAPAEASVIVLSGAAGCGKTVAAAWWSVRHTATPVFVRATTFAASSRYDRETRATWFSAPALVLDDLGTEYLDAKGSFLVDLDELLDVYYGDRRPLVITTNCSKPVFKTRYGERVTDRLRECGVWFETKAEPMRSGRRDP